jgi:hypothetical protein
MKDIIDRTDQKSFPSANKCPVIVTWRVVNVVTLACRITGRYSARLAVAVAAGLVVALAAQ